jgi:hypothetical protein
MELFIRVDENGNAVQHPMLGANVREAFPHIDLNNLPPEFARFVRTPRPTILGVYEVFDDEAPPYQLVDGVFTDVWPTRNMTDVEKTEKQQKLQEKFNGAPDAANFSTWVLDEATCTMQPPIPRPPKDPTKIALNIFTYWCGAENAWKDTPAKPVDENQYVFDFIVWQWVPLVN